MTNSEGLLDELEAAQQVNEDAELVIATLAAQLERLERTVGHLQRMVLIIAISLLAVVAVVGLRL